MFSYVGWANMGTFDETSKFSDVAATVYITDRNPTLINV
jgi:hypothetical protein